jgi:hypothetical protein
MDAPPLRPPPPPTGDGEVDGGAGWAGREGGGLGHRRSVGGVRGAGGGGRAGRAEGRGAQGAGDRRWGRGGAEQNKQTQNLFIFFNRTFYLEKKNIYIYIYIYIYIGHRGGDGAVRLMAGLMDG